MILCKYLSISDMVFWINFEKSNHSHSECIWMATFFKAYSCGKNFQGMYSCMWHQFREQWFISMVTLFSDVSFILLKLRSRAQGNLWFDEWCEGKPCTVVSRLILFIGKLYLYGAIQLMIVQPEKHERWAKLRCWSFTACTSRTRYELPSHCPSDHECWIEGWIPPKTKFQIEQDKVDGEYPSSHSLNHPLTLSDYVDIEHCRSRDGDFNLPRACILGTWITS